jgi:Permeases of the drug/metabolite transporter (DMT) superfamily
LGYYFYNNYTGGGFVKNNLLLGHILCFITVFVWGTTFISSKILLAYFQPIELLFLRFIIGYIVLLIIHPKFYKINSWKEEIMFFSMGLTGVTVYFLAENMALEKANTSSVSLLVSTAPLFTALFAHIYIKGENLRKNFLLGFLVAIIGVSLVIFNKSSFTFKLSVTGNILAVIAAMVWAIYSILLKKIGNKYNYIVLTRKVFFYGLITMIPFMFAYKANIHMSNVMIPIVYLNLLFLGIGASSACYVMWNTAVNMIGVVKSSSYIYLIPLVTIVTAYIVINENITIFAIIGGVLILIGLYISEHEFKIK